MPTNMCEEVNKIPRRSLPVRLGIIAFMLGVILVLGIVNSRIGKPENTNPTSPDKERHEEIRLGYCPTMKPEAEQLAKKFEYIVLERMESAAEVMIALKYRLIDIALIGRIANEEEKINSKEKVLGTGYTLISSTRRFVQIGDVSSVHTAVAEEKAKELLPHANLEHYSSLEEAKQKGLAEAVLISWNDYSGEELVVVMNGNEKVRDFRIPVIYSLHYDLDDFSLIA